MTSGSIKKFALLNLVLSLFSITPALAQDNNGLDLFVDEMVLEEIIVTARKRQEALQDTPVAISALSAQALKDAGISNIRDLQQHVPGLNFSEQGSKNPSIFIRGVGQRESNTALDPGVGVYINNIYIARTDGQLLDTLDTESIQVLRGPQGTLFGKNNTGGAMLVTTKAPHTEAFEGYFSTRLGSFGRRDAKFSANVPLNDENLALRLSVNSVVMDGYLESVFDNKKYADENRLAATARVQWQASDTFSVDLFTYWSKQNERGAAFSCFFINPNAALATFAWPGDADKHNFKERCDVSKKISDDDEVLINGPSRFTLTNQIAAMTLTWEFDDLEIKSITALSRQSDIIIQDDQDAVDIPAVNNGSISLRDGLRDSLLGFQEYVIAGGAQLTIPDIRPGPGSSESDLVRDDTFGDHGELDDEERQQFSQEIQFIGSAFDESLSYTFGAFYADEDMDNTVFTQTNGILYFPGVGVVHKFIGSQSDIDNETYAFFAQSTLDVNDWFQLTGGIRYTVENREREATIYASNCTAIHALNLIPSSSDAICSSLDIVQISPALADEFLANPPSFLPIQRVQHVFTVPDPQGNSELIFTNNGVISDKRRFTKTTPTLTASFNIPEEYFDNSVLDTSLIYLTWAKGFKAGGFEMKGAEMVDFKPENVVNYEIGWKTDAFENRLRFNMAIYLMDYDDLQVRIAESGKGLADIFLFISNAGDATIKGLEMEFMALPMDRLTVQMSMNYTDASYDEFTTTVAFPSPAIVDRSDEEFGSIPELTYSITAIYEIDTNIGIFTPRLTLYFRDDVYTGIDDVSNGIEGDPRTDGFEDISTIDSYTLLNFRLAFAPLDDKFNITFYIDNLADKDYFQGGFTVAATVGAANLIKASPRAFGLEASYNF